MNMTPIKLLIFMIIFSVIIFIIDILFPGTVIPGLYIFAVLMSLWSEENYILILSMVICLSLIIVSFFISSDVISFLFILNKIICFIMVGLIGVFVAKRKEIEYNLLRMKETLELRVLARTVAAEAKSIRLEQQIKVLQLLRQNNTNSAFQALDEVISNLKCLSDKDV